MSISSDFVGRLKVVVTCFAILGTVAFPASGQQGHLSGVSGNIDINNEIVEVENGLTAERGGKLDEAILHFQKAVLLNPDDNSAKIWLADALSKRVKPGVDTPENLKIAQQAINLYQEVIAKPNPTGMAPLRPVAGEGSITVMAMRQIAHVYFNINNLDESKAWQKKVLAVDAKDDEAAYSVGVIDWMQAHHNALTALKAAGITDDGMGNAKAPIAVMETIKGQNRPLVEEALLYLNQAVENRPNYDDAMAYLNLVYRKKADLDFGNDAARLADVAKANEWRRKAMEAHKANEAKKAAEAQAAKP